MQGITLDGDRLKTKKALKEADIAGLYLEATSVFGNEYNGPLSQAPANTYYVVGPDPYTDRRWYATITVNPNGVKIS